MDPPEESDEESGDEGIELFIVPILAVINCNEKKKHRNKSMLCIQLFKGNVTQGLIKLE